MVLPRADPLRRHRRADQRAGRLLHRRLGRGRPAPARRAGAAAPALTVASRRWRSDRDLGGERCWPGPRRPGPAATATAAMAFFGRAADLAEADGDLDDPRRGGARPRPRPAVQPDPGLLPVRLHAAYDAVDGAAARGPGWPRRWRAAGPTRTSRAGPGRSRSRRCTWPTQLDDPVLLADALDAALASHWGPDDLARRRDWAVRLDDAAAHLADPDARLQAQLWALTVAWEVLDLPRMHRSHARHRAAGRGVAAGRVLRGDPPAPARAAAPAPRRRAAAGRAGRARPPRRR